MARKSRCFGQGGRLAGAKKKFISQIFRKSIAIELVISYCQVPKKKRDIFHLSFRFDPSKGQNGPKKSLFWPRWPAGRGKKKIYLTDFSNVDSNRVRHFVLPGAEKKARNFSEKFSF